MPTRNEKIIDPYDILGIETDATIGDVQAAYRRRAKDTHPDAGGSAREFTDVKLAHSVLSDPERRARYDRTGEIDDAEPDNTDQGALGLIGVMLEALLAAENDPVNCDLVATMKAHFATQIIEITRKLEKTRRSIDRAQRMRGRFRRNKPGENTVERVLDWEIDVLQRAIRTNEAALQQRERAVKILTEYDFAQDISKVGFKVRRGFVPLDPRAKRS